MDHISRLYKKIVTDHMATLDEMIFLAGPRQVGKTTIAKEILKDYGHGLYLNWDELPSRDMIAQGQANLLNNFIQAHPSSKLPLIIFDEIHKMPSWQTWIKGFFDMHSGKAKILVTGSAQLDVYMVGGDSMRGRYFLYRIHPLTVGEVQGNRHIEVEIHQQSSAPNDTLERLLEFGGFPRPYVKADKRFSVRWDAHNAKQLFQQDIREITNIRQINQVELLAACIKAQVARGTSYASLARKIQVSEVTIKMWLETLKRFYYSFEIRPWSRNISRSLVKEPKYYLWNWAHVKQGGARMENFIASHLLKSVHSWSDSGLGRYGLYYVKDKLKREVDFLVTRDDEPWFLVEVKTSKNNGLSPALSYFHKTLKTEHAFQVAFDMSYIDVNLFKINHPVIVPVHTFLSQLM